MARSGAIVAQLPLLATILMRSFPVAALDDVSQDGGRSGSCTSASIGCGCRRFTDVFIHDSPTYLTPLHGMSPSLTRYNGGRTAHTIFPGEKLQEARVKFAADMYHYEVSDISFTRKDNLSQYLVVCWQETIPMQSLFKISWLARKTEAYTSCWKTGQTVAVGEQNVGQEKQNVGQGEQKRDRMQRWGREFDILSVILYKMYSHLEAPKWNEQKWGRDFDHLGRSVISSWDTARFFPDGSRQFVPLWQGGETHLLHIRVAILKFLWADGIMQSPAGWCNTYGLPILPSLPYFLMHGDESPQ